MVLSPILLTCAKGLGLGLLHALESDHIAAVTTLVTRGHGTRRAAVVGATWGIGHALAIVGLGAILLALGIRMPERVSLLLDGAVIVMLVLLGAQAILRRDQHPANGHQPSTPRTPLRAMAVGLVHGASGTGALALVVMTTLPNRLHGLWYLMLFAFGATVSMMTLTSLLSLPIRAAVTRWNDRSIRALRLAAGTFSLCTAGVLFVETTAAYARTSSPSSAQVTLAASAAHHRPAIAEEEGSVDERLREVIVAHGEAGPWAVAGYRMGEYALHQLDLPHHSFDLEIVHESPAAVQFMCIVDGAAAATGASLGKMNLTHVTVDETRLRTTYRKRSSGQTLVLRPARAFVERFMNLGRRDFAAAGRVVMTLPENEVFAVEAATPEQTPR